MKTCVFEGEGKFADEVRLDKDIKVNSADDQLIEWSQRPDVGKIFQFYIVKEYGQGFGRSCWEILIWYSTLNE